MKALAQDRLKVVDLMRTVSILAVMSLHFHFDDPAPGSSPAMYALATFAKGGSYGVLLFFVISGFVISRVIDMRYGGLFEIDVRDFYARRIARIWPLLITTVTIGLLLVLQLNMISGPIPEVFSQILSPRTAKFDGWFFVSLCTLTNNILVVARPDMYGLMWGILWSIAVEEQFYLFYPQALKRLKTTRNLVIFLSVFIALALPARWLYKVYGPPMAFLASLGSFDLLAMGIMLLLAVKKYGDALKEKPLVCWLLVVGGFLLSSFVYVMRQDEVVLHWTFAPTFFGAGAFMFLLGGLNLKAMDRLPFVLTYPGQLSYGMYLYHPLMLLAVAFLSVDRLWLFAAYTIGNILWSACSFHMYERPLDRLVYGKLKKTG